MLAFGLVVFLVFMIAIGFWILPFVMIVAIGSAFSLATSTIIFRIIGPPELSK